MERIGNSADCTSSDPGWNGSGTLHLPDPELCTSTVAKVLCSVNRDNAGNSISDTVEPILIATDANSAPATRATPSLMRDDDVVLSVETNLRAVREQSRAATYR